MTKNHLKRIAMPTTWNAKEKKKLVWVARPNPGAHSLREGMPLILVLRDLLKYSNTARETKHILNNKQILIDGIKRKDHRFNVGFMDVVSIPELKEEYRIILDKNGRLNLSKIDEKESKIKICKIKGKGLSKGKMELRLSDGRTMLLDKKDNFKTGDSIVIGIPEQKIISHLPIEKGSFIIMIDGKKIGSTGIIEGIKGNFVSIKSKEGIFETLKKNCFVLGKQKSELKIE